MVVVTSELDLPCATCGGVLREATIAPDALRFDTHEPLSVAECADCGGRYYPERTLDRIDGRTGS